MPSATLPSVEVGERGGVVGLNSLMPQLRPAAGLRGSRVDRLGWTTGTCIETYGVRVGIRVNEPGLLPLLEPHLPPGWETVPSAEVDRLFSLRVDTRVDPPGRTFRIYDERARRARTHDRAEAFAILESEIRQGIAAAARDWVFVHAGVVGWKGRALVVPGRSRSGKTTLVVELVRAGAEYYSDEFAVLDLMGRVHPFVKPLSIRGPGGCDVHVRRPSAEELGGLSGRRALPVGLVALLAHRPGAEWEPIRLSAGQAVLEMLGHTVPARLRPEASLTALERAVQSAIVLKGERGEARETVPRLLECMESSS
jgi:hypothetical protein